MRLLARRGRALLVGTALLLSACDSSSGSPTSSPDPSSSSSARPSLPVATGSAAALTLGPALWSTRTRRLPDFRQAAVADGIAVLTGHSAVAALDARTGRVLWSHRTDEDSAVLGGGDIEFSPVTTLFNRDTLITPVTPAGRLVLVGYAEDGDRQSYGLAALSLRTGELVWTARVGGDPLPAPVVRVAGVSAANVLVASTPQAGRDTESVAPRSLVLDTATGKVRWQRDNVLAWQLSGETAVLTDVTGTRVGTDPGQAVGPLVGWDATTARQRWRIPNPYGSGRVDSATDRTVLVGSGSTVLLDTATGRALWRSASSAYCDSDGRRLVACVVGDRLVSWSTPDPVVRSSTRTVDGLVRRVEDGRVYLQSPGEPDAVVDVSGRSLVTAPLPDQALTAVGGIAIFTSTEEYADGVLSARSVRS